MAGFEIYLIGLAEGFDIFQPMLTTTTDLANRFGISQQSVSRILMSMQDQGLILRYSSPKGVSIKITDAALDWLRQVGSSLSRHFSPGNLEFSGIIEDGLKEGKYYVSHPGYSREFKRLLGLVPYPGTLNIRIDAINARRLRYGFTPIDIKGFKTKKRTFGAIHCYRCVIDGKWDGWVIHIDRTNHPEDVLEIISKEHLRRKVKGESIEVSVYDGYTRQTGDKN